MKTKKLPKEKVETKEVRERVLQVISKGKKDEFWSAHNLSRKYRIPIEHMEHYLIDLAQKGKLMIGTDHDGQLWVGANEKLA